MQAANGQSLLTSTYYPDKDTALRRIDTVRSLACRGSNLDVCSTGDGQFYIVLKDNERKVLGQSGMIASRQGLQKGLDAIKKCSSRTRLIDRTRPGKAAVSSDNPQPSAIIQEGIVTSSRILLTQNVKGYYSFTFQAQDEQVLLTSPFFTDKKYTLSRIALARSLAQRKESFEARTAETGQLYMMLINTRQEEVARTPVFGNSFYL